MGIEVKAGFQYWGKKLFSSVGKILGIKFVVEDSDDMDGHKVAESGITVGARDLSVIVLYSLVLVMLVIAFVELFVLVHLEVYFRI